MDWKVTFGKWTNESKKKKALLDKVPQVITPSVLVFFCWCFTYKTEGVSRHWITEDEVSSDELICGSHDKLNFPVYKGISLRAAVRVSMQTISVIEYWFVVF